MLGGFLFNNCYQFIILPLGTQLFSHSKRLPLGTQLFGSKNLVFGTLPLHTQPLGTLPSFRSTQLQVCHNIDLFGK